MKSGVTAEYFTYVTESVSVLCLQNRGNQLPMRVKTA